MRFQKFTAVAVVLITSGFAQDSPEPSSSKENGRLSPDGKFLPKPANTDVEKAPYPEARLKEPGVRFDGEVLKTGTAEVDRRSLTVSPPRVKPAENHVAITMDRPQVASGESSFSNPRDAVGTTRVGPIISLITGGSNRIRKSPPQTQPKNP